MVMVQRRLNSTGRKRIPRDRIDIELIPPLDAFSFPVATATINLSDLGLDAGARVVLQAYFRSSSMRFNCGTVDAVLPPSRLVLNDIDRGGAIRFRLLIIADDGTGRIISSAEGLRPRQAADSTERQPLLNVREADIGEELWRLDISGRDEPVLVLNSRISGLAARLRSDPLLQGLVLPHALREVLRNLPSEGEDDEDRDWGEGWRRFLRNIEMPTEPEGRDDENKQEWIETIIDHFCRLKRFVGIVRQSEHYGDIENA